MATELRKIRPIVQADLKTLADRVFYERTKGAPTFPYVVFTINGLGYSEVIKTAELEIAIYDNKDDTTALEALAENIWQHLDHKYYIDNTACFNTYQNIRYSAFVDEGIHQRTLQFELRIC